MSEQSIPCSDIRARDFDFWVGEWDLSWPAQQTGGEEGDVGRGINRISKKFGECVVEENFATSDGKFFGHSVSVYDPDAGLWRQTWVDSGGTYLLFTGRYEAGTLELRTAPVERDSGEIAVNRMVFSDIHDNSLSWDWQGSKNGGETWHDLWNISYNRAS